MNPAHYVFGLPTLTFQEIRRDPSLCSFRRGFSCPPAPAAAAAGDFYADPDEVLLSVEYAQVSPPQQYELFIPLRGLQALLTPESRGHYTPWAIWGPTRAHATPLLRFPPIVGWRNHSIFGMRRIGMYPTLREDGVLVAKIYDYHPRRVASAEREAYAEGRRWEVIEGETVNGDWLGVGELKTDLHYIETVVPLPEELQRHRGSMVTLGINDDGIVACTVRTVMELLALY